MPETEAAPAAVEAQPSPTFDTAGLDAILEKIRPLPRMDSASDAIVPEDPSKPVVVKTPNSESVPEVPTAPPVEPVEAPKPAAPASPFEPPPSVLGELTEAVVETDPIEAEYGTLPEAAPPEFKSKEAKESYAKMRQNHEKLKSDLRAMQTAAKQKSPPDEGLAAQLADVTARNAELIAIVERKAAEELPFVRREFDEPRKQLFNIAASALKKVDIDPSRLGKILSLTGKDRVDAVDELYGEIESPTTRDRVTQAINQIDMIEDRRADFLADREGNVQRQTAAEKAEQYRQFAAQEKAVDDSIDEAIDLLANKIGFEHWRKSQDPNATEWNGRIGEREKVLRFLSKENKDPKLLVRVLAAGVVAEDVRKWALSLQEQLSAERKKVAEYEGTMPSLNGNSAAEKFSANGTFAKDADEMAAAGILPDDSLSVQSRKLGAYWNRNGR